MQQQNRKWCRVVAYAKHVQACMFVFISGGKEDKNLCRYIMNQQCGMEVDYKCKQSGWVV